MDGLDLKNIPFTNFIFDFKTPGGYLPFGYTKHTIGENIIRKLKSINDEPHTGYYPSLERPYEFHFNRTSAFSTYIVEHTPKTAFNLTTEIKDDVKLNELYVVVLEALNVNNLFEYYSSDKFELDDFFSPELISLLKTHINFKIVLMDSREGAYKHDEILLIKINKFLDKHNISHKNKIIISTNNNFITKLNDSKQMNDRIAVYSNNYCLLTAGRFISELRVKNNSIVENEYEFSIQEELTYTDKEKYFLMYNRNSERMHRPYFVNKLYKENLLDLGYVSFFENPYFEEFLKNSSVYPELGLIEEDINDIRKNYKNYYPLTIDETDSERVADFHNFLSRKNEYQNSYFTIISETNAESDYSFITEKTIKPIMNLHPFVVLGNPNTLEVLKSYGFITFDKWWDESYDMEIDFKKRTEMVFNIVKDLCSKSKNEMNDMVKEMEQILIHNKRTLHKLCTNKTFQKEFFRILTKGYSII
jgi:hypothetical protein